MTRQRLAELPLHPLLVAAYAVLFLYGQNLGETNPADVALPLVASVVGVAIVLGVMYLVTRDAARAAIATSALAVLFSSYGHVLAAVRSSAISGGRLLVVWAVLGAIVVVAAWRLRRPLGTANGRLNVVAVILVVIALVPIVAGEVGSSLAGPAAVAPSASPGEGSAGPDRDIYVIVIEDIGSEAIMREQWGLEGDSPFTHLEGLGFTRVADSHTNYGKTGHALASMFNLEYLDDLAARMGPDSADFGPIYQLVDNHAAGRFLKERGYEYVHIGAWWDPTARSSIADVNLGLETPSDFATAFLDTTMLPAITSRLARFGIRLGTQALEAHELQYQSALTGFSALESTLDRPGRTFVFAHFLIPHDPYVFAQDGSFVTEDQRADRTIEQLFIDQSLYTMARVDAFVDKALAGPDETDPIIIFTTDEGPNPRKSEIHPDTYDYEKASVDDLREKLEIELEFYFPDVTPAEAGIHDGMSLVNVFRSLFDAYFGTSYGRLPDRSFIYPNKAHPYRLTDVTDRIAR